jgi:hypothetical protein
MITIFEQKDQTLFHELITGAKICASSIKGKGKVFPAVN